MGFADVAVIGVGLAMDACAVAISNGLKMKKFNIRQAFGAALMFALFQAVMPVIGWAVGIQFSGYIDKFDHWIAFALLVFLGGKMIVDSFGKEKEDTAGGLGIKRLLVQAVATSIDALAVGVTFSFSDVNIWISVLIIGAITLVLSLLGAYCGFRIGTKLKSKAEIFGGIVLIIIGIKILLEGLGVIPF